MFDCNAAPCFLLHNTYCTGRSKAEGGATGQGTGTMGLMLLEEGAAGKTLYLTWGSSATSVKRYGPVLGARASF